MLGSTSCSRINPVKGKVCATCTVLRRSIETLKEIIDMRDKFLDLGCNYILKGSIERGVEEAIRGHRKQVKDLWTNRDGCIKKFYGLDCNKCQEFKNNPLRDSYFN